MALGYSLHQCRHPVIIVSDGPQLGRILGYVFVIRNCAKHLRIETIFARGSGVVAHHPNLRFYCISLTPHRNVGISTPETKSGHHG